MKRYLTVLALLASSCALPATGPIALDDIATTTVEAPVSANVLANDRGPLGEDMTLIGASSDSGTVSFTGDGTIDFLPAAGFIGTALVRYIAEAVDGSQASAVLRVEVSGIPNLRVETPQGREFGPVPIGGIAALPVVLTAEDGPVEVAASVTNLVLDLPAGCRRLENGQSCGLELIWLPDALGRFDGAATFNGATLQFTGVAVHALSTERDSIRLEGREGETAEEAVVVSSNVDFDIALDVVWDGHDSIEFSSDCPNRLAAGDTCELRYAVRGTDDNAGRTLDGVTIIRYSDFGTELAVAVAATIAELPITAPELVSPVDEVLYVPNLEAATPLDWNDVARAEAYAAEAELCVGAECRPGVVRLSGSGGAATFAVDDLIWLFNNLLEGFDSTMQWRAGTVVGQEIRWSDWAVNALTALPIVVLDYRFEPPPPATIVVGQPIGLIVEFQVFAPGIRVGFTPRAVEGASLSGGSVQEIGEGRQLLGFEFTSKQPDIVIGVDLTFRVGPCGLECIFNPLAELTAEIQIVDP